MKRILVLIDYSSEFSRRLLKGLIQYSKDNGPWIFYRLPTYYKALYGKEGIVEWAKEWKADAIIARWDHEGTNLLTTVNIPILLQNYKERSPYFSNLTGDYIGTGEMAARFFIKRRFRNFAFYGNKGVVWSRERLKVPPGSRKRAETTTITRRKHEWRRMGTSYIELDEWLLSLPKPLASLLAMTASPCESHRFVPSTTSRFLKNYLCWEWITTR